MLIHSLDSGRIVLELSTKSGSKFINLGGEDQNRIDEDDDHPVAARAISSAEKSWRRSSETPRPCASIICWTSVSPRTSRSRLTDSSSTAPTVQSVMTEPTTDPETSSVLAFSDTEHGSEPRAVDRSGVMRSLRSKLLATCWRGSRTRRV